MPHTPSHAACQPLGKRFAVPKKESPAERGFLDKQST
jgi:hypothetical protein